MLKFGDELCRVDGPILESMAAAVENSDVVLVCFSRKYKDSPYCEKGSAYA